MLGYDRGLFRGFGGVAVTNRCFQLAGVIGLSALLLLPGCGWPRVHKVVVQQGNVITQGMIDKLKPGMTRAQVSFIMGDPVVHNTFGDSRWDYVYTIENPGVYQNAINMSLFFEGDLLAYFTGDLAPTVAKPSEAIELDGDESDEPADSASAPEDAAAGTDSVSS